MRFFKKKQARNIGSPYNVMGNSQYQMIPGGGGANNPIPSLLDWQLSSSAGGGGTPRDGVLGLIDRYLNAYYHSSDPWEKVSILGQLYFLTDRWLREARVRRDPREPGVLELFIAVVDNLCYLLDCTVNYLPTLIEQYWGRILTKHGYDLDNRGIPRGGLPTVADYLTAAEREKYRLIFNNGLAYQSTWWAVPPYSLELAESNMIGWTDARGPRAPQMMETGFAGFAMSMGRDIFMATHHGSYNKDNFFHSSYLAGGTVLCTGTILIERGRVRAIKNDSGHYRPTLEHLMNVVHALGMYGVPPSTLTVIAVAGSWTDAHGHLSTLDLVTWGNDVLAWGSNGADVQRCKQSNDRNIAARPFVLRPIVP
jgi:hypothetical protein